MWDTHQTAERIRINGEGGSKMGGFKVVYFVLGTRRTDEFSTYEEAQEDFEKKRRIDCQGFMDDRFVGWIEDIQGNILRRD
jgi:hypothetical protein